MLVTLSLISSKGNKLQVKSDVHFQLNVRDTESFINLLVLIFNRENKVYKV